MEQGKEDAGLYSCCSDAFDLAAADREAKDGALLQHLSTPALSRVSYCRDKPSLCHCSSSAQGCPAVANFLLSSLNLHRRGSSNKTETESPSAVPQLGSSGAKNPQSCFLLCPAAAHPQHLSRRAVLLTVFEGM